MDDVLQYIQALDIYKAVGIDGIPTRFVKIAVFHKSGKIYVRIHMLSN